MCTIKNIKSLYLNDSFRNSLYNFCKENLIDYYEDNADNIIIHFKSNNENSNLKKILVPILLNKNEIIITDIKNSKAYFKCAEHIKESSFCNLYPILNGNKAGKICSEKNAEQKDEYYIDISENCDVKKGDICSITFQNICKADTLYGRVIDAEIQLLSLMYMLSRFDKSRNDLYFTVSFCENSLLYLAKKLKPDYIFRIYGSEAAKEDEISSGCGIVLKDGGFVASPVMKDSLKQHINNIKHTYFCGKISALCEKLSLISADTDVCAVTVPIKYMHSESEIADLNDIQNASDILMNMFDI